MLANKLRQKLIERVRKWREPLRDDKQERINTIMELVHQMHMSAEDAAEEIQKIEREKNEPLD